MRIFYAVEYEPFLGSRLWYNNLYLPLTDLGHEVVLFDYPIDPHYAHANEDDPKHRDFIKRNRPRLEQALLEQIRAAHADRPIDLFFSYFYNAHCRPEVIQEIRRMGIVTMNWYCNASYQFHLVSKIAPSFDYCLVPEKLRLDDYRRIGANPIHCQEAANPNIYKPYQLLREFDVVFVGQKYGDRPEYVRYLLDGGIDVRVWGKGWQLQDPPQSAGGRIRRLRGLTKREGWKAAGRKVRWLIAPPPAPVKSPIGIPPEICGPSLSDEQLVKMYSRSKISLGFSSCGETHRAGERIAQVRLRDFEAPMSGTFYMVEYMEELEEFYDIGKEIVCYHDKEDLADKIKYYLNHDLERERIRQAGYRRAVSEHTWQKRFECVFREIGLTS